MKHQSEEEKDWRKKWRAAMKAERLKRIVSTEEVEGYERENVFELIDMLKKRLAQGEWKIIELERKDIWRTIVNWMILTKQWKGAVQWIVKENGVWRGEKSDINEKREKMLSIWYQVVQDGDIDAVKMILEETKDHEELKRKMIESSCRRFVRTILGGEKSINVIRWIVDERQLVKEWGWDIFGAESAKSMVWEVVGKSREEWVKYDGLKWILESSQGKEDRLLWYEAMKREIERIEKSFNLEIKKEFEKEMLEGLSLIKVWLEWGDLRGMIKHEEIENKEYKKDFEGQMKRL